ncbi:STXA protein, partial [Polypterus senegalus]
MSSRWFPTLLCWLRPSVAEVLAVLLAAHRVSFLIFNPALPGVAEVLRISTVYSEKMAEQPISITTAVLGRPFQLGMLYDCRSDQLVPGVTLWSKSVLEKDISVKSQRLTEYSLETSNSLTDKSKALNINASLRGSFACGLVEVGGSAKYLNNSKSSKNQARVTLNYFMTTMFKQLTMSHLSRNNVTYEEVFRQGTATHVVTAILYGARALMVFDRDVSKDESTHAIVGELKVSIKKIPHFTIHGKGSVDLSAKEKEEAKNIRCTFHGDFYIRELPVDYLTALDVYKKLPSFLGEDGEHAVPVTVWLYPLSLLDSSAARLMYEISTDLVTQAECVLDSLLEAEMMCDYLLTESLVKSFYNIEEKISKFKTLIERYKLYFQKRLAQILPSVRGGATNATALGDILEVHGTSPFSQHKLEGWLCSLQTEIRVIEALIKGMEDSNVSLLTGRFDRIEPLIFEPNINYIVDFNFNLLSKESKSLNTMENYFISEEISGIRSTDMVNNDEWVHSQVNCDKIRLRRKLFLDFASNNQQNEATKFVVTSRPVEMQESSSILLYCKGELRSSDFEPPSTPDVPKILKTSSQSAEIELSLPPHGSNETIKYLVQFRKHTERQWRSQMTRDTEKCFTLEGLQRSTQYDVRYAAICEVGVGPPSEVISVNTGEPGEQVIADPIEDDPSKDLTWHREQCYPPVVAAIQAMTLPFPDRDDKSHFPIGWDDDCLPNGSKDCLQCQEDSLTTSLEKFTLDTTDPCSLPYHQLVHHLCNLSETGGSQLIGGSASRNADSEISNILAG